MSLRDEHLEIFPEDENPDQFHVGNDPFDLKTSGGINRVWITTERESPNLLTKDDILALGFLRSDPQRHIYRHKDVPSLYLIEIFYQDFSIKDFMQRKVLVWSDKRDGQQWQLYQSTKPNKEEIELAIKPYAA